MSNEFFIVILQFEPGPKVMAPVKAKDSIGALQQALATIAHARPKGAAAKAKVIGPVRKDTMRIEQHYRIVGDEISHVGTNTKADWGVLNH